MLLFSSITLFSHHNNDNNTMNPQTLSIVTLVSVGRRAAGPGSGPALAAPAALPLHAPRPPGGHRGGSPYTYTIPTFTLRTVIQAEPRPGPGPPPRTLPATCRLLRLPAVSREGGAGGGGGGGGAGGGGGEGGGRGEVRGGPGGGSLPAADQAGVLHPLPRHHHLTQHYFMLLL